MTWDRWITVVFLCGGGLVQVGLFIDAWVHRRADGERQALARLDRLEKDLEKIRAKTSDESGQWQRFIGDVSVRMALIEQSCKTNHHEAKGH